MADAPYDGSPHGQWPHRIVLIIFCLVLHFGQQKDYLHPWLGVPGTTEGWAPRPTRPSTAASNQCDESAGARFVILSQSLLLTRHHRTSPPPPSMSSMPFSSPLRPREAPRSVRAVTRCTLSFLYRRIPRPEPPFRWTPAIFSRSSMEAADRECCSGRQTWSFHPHSRPFQDLGSRLEQTPLGLIQSTDH